jgi:DNA polymerase III epsilon subunit-like protein
MTTTIILDFETSGLNPYHDDIIEIAMKVLGSEKKFEALIKPKSNVCISEEITALTGITNGKLSRQGGTWEEVYEAANDWILSVVGSSGKVAIVSHNGESFDFIFLRRLFNDLRDYKAALVPLFKGPRYKIFPLADIVFIDTLLLARRLVPGRMSYRQASLCGMYNISVKGSHRAMNDVVALEKLYIQLSRSLDEKMDKRRSPVDYPDMIEGYIKLK